MSANAIVPVKRDSIRSRLTNLKRAASKFSLIPEPEYDNFMELGERIGHSLMRDSQDPSASIRWRISRIVPKSIDFEEGRGYNPGLLIRWIYS